MSSGPLMTMTVLSEKVEILPFEDLKEGKVCYQYGEGQEEVERMDYLEFIARVTSFSVSFYNSPQLLMGKSSQSRPLGQRSQKPNSYS
jgi:hypothetical protein